MEAYTSYLETQQLNPKTIKNHIRNLKQYQSDGYALNDNEKKTISNLKTYEEGSKRQTMTSTISKYRTYMNYDNKKVREFIQTPGKARRPFALHHTKQLALKFYVNTDKKSGEKTQRYHMLKK